MYNANTQNQDYPNPMQMPHSHEAVTAEEKKATSGLPTTDQSGSEVKHG